MFVESALENLLGHEFTSFQFHAYPVQFPFVFASFIHLTTVSKLDVAYFLFVDFIFALFLLGWLEALGSLGKYQSQIIIPLRYKRGTIRTRLWIPDYERGLWDFSFPYIYFLLFYLFPKLFLVSNSIYEWNLLTCSL